MLPSAPLLPIYCDNDLEYEIVAPIYKSEENTNENIWYFNNELCKENIKARKILNNLKSNKNALLKIENKINIIQNDINNLINMRDNIYHALAKAHEKDLIELNYEKQKICVGNCDYVSLENTVEKWNKYYAHAQQFLEKHKLTFMQIDDITNIDKFAVYIDNLLAEYGKCCKRCNKCKNNCNSIFNTFYSQENQAEYIKQLKLFTCYTNNIRLLLIYFSETKHIMLTSAKISITIEKMNDIFFNKKINNAFNNKNSDNIINIITYVNAINGLEDISNSFYNSDYTKSKNKKHYYLF